MPSNIPRREKAMRIKSRCVVVAAIALTVPPLSAAMAADSTWQQRVGDALGKAGTEMPGGVYRVGLPRTDLHVKLDGVDIKPGLALGSWLAFKEMGGNGN